MSNPDIAQAIRSLVEEVPDANQLVRGMLQSSLGTALQAEMDAHLGYASGDRETKAEAGQTNSRNGSYTKTVESSYGPLQIQMPRDRAGTFTPQMVPKGARRLTDVDEMIVSLYAGGMTVRDIQYHLTTTLRLDLSPQTISDIVDQVLEKVLAWQQRELDSFYPVIFLDAIRIKVRDEGRVTTKSAYMAIGVDMEGTKHILRHLDRQRRRSLLLGPSLR